MGRFMRYVSRAFTRFKMAGAVLGLVFVIGSSGFAAQAEKTPADYVDPWIESAKSRYFFFNTASRPFGMVNLSPDTTVKSMWNSGYRYNDKTTYGMTHTRCWQTAGLLIIPTMGIDPCKGLEGWKSEFSHDNETVQAGYHKLTLDRYDIDVELTSTARVGVHRYTFNKAGTADILVWLGGELGGVVMNDAHIEKVSDREIAGSVAQAMWFRRGRDVKPNDPRLHFVMQVDKAPESWQAWQGSEPLGALTDSVRGDDHGAFARYKVEAGDQVVVRVGLSWNSIEQARLNLETELDHWDFDRVRNESRNEWNQWLSKIEVKGGTEKQRVKFYTDLWHSLLGRRQLHDVDGKYPLRMKGKREIGQLPLNENGEPSTWFLNSDSMWITKWNLNMLWGMAYPEMVERFIDTGLICYQKGNHLPRAVVVGKNDTIMTGCTWTELIVGAYMKGIRGFDSDLALNAMLSGHNPGGTMGVGYNDVPDYLKLGYCPLQDPPKPFGSAGRTMEYAASDWALAQYGKALGRDDIYDAFMKRSGNWRNLFDSELGFIRPKLKDGSWRTPFDPLMDANRKGFVEANSWQTTWMATHDVEGLAKLLGGRDQYCEKLNYAFENSRKANFTGKYGDGFVSFGNQPGLAMAHLFNYAGKPWLSQYWVRQVNEHCYGGITSDSGYGGHDEDQGIMGATSALMSMGLSQVRGGCSQEPIYEITAPVFDEVTIHLDSRYYPGKTFRIVTKNNAPENVYIQSAKLNGNQLDNCWFYHRDFVKGGTLELVLGPQPNKSWGVKVLPPSVTRDEPEYARALTNLPTVNVWRPISARGEHGPVQTAAEAFDGDIATKWLDFSPQGSWIQRDYREKPIIVSKYAITSAEDAPNRDPKYWQLLGSNDGETWITLDSRSNERWSDRNQRRSFSLSNKTAYRIYRLNISAVGDLKTANSVQISEIEFLKDDSENASGTGQASKDAEVDLLATEGFQLNQHWELKDGVLSSSKTPGGIFWSTKRYGDFQITLDYRTSKECNSGLFFRSDPRNPVQGGFEIQIASNGKYDGRHVVGSIFDAKAPTKEAGRPDGEWNTMVVSCRGPEIKVVLNGEQVLEANIDQWTTPRKNPDGSPNKFKIALKDLPKIGHIGLQYHGQSISFRNIQIKPLISVGKSGTSQLVQNLEAGKKQTVVTFGTSLTAVGAWVHQLREVLNQQYPGQVTLINGAQGGANSDWGRAALDEKVLKHKPDTVFIEFAVNDAVASRQSSVDKAQNNLEDMIARILKVNPDCEIILMVMNPPVAHTKVHRPNLAAYNQMYRDLAKERGFQLIDHYPVWEKLLNDHPGKFLFYVPDTIHPIRVGALAVITPSLTKALGLKPGKPELDDASPCWVYLMTCLMDKDKDRGVTRVEFNAYWAGIFNSNDKDKDGALKPDEFGPQVLFEYLDADGSGLVSLDELLRVYAPHFDNRDKNRDGVLTKGELPERK